LNPVTCSSNSGSPTYTGASIESTRSAIAIRHFWSSSIDRSGYPAAIALLMTFAPSATNSPSAGSRLRRNSTSVSAT
jgi:hypothetical protein